MHLLEDPLPVHRDSPGRASQKRSDVSVPDYPAKQVPHKLSLRGREPVAFA